MIRKGEKVPVATVIATLPQHRVVAAVVVSCPELRRGAAGYECGVLYRQLLSLYLDPQASATALCENEAEGEVSQLRRGR